MPCRSDYSDSELSEGEKRSRPLEKMRRELDATTDMLCRLCKHLSKDWKTAFSTMPKDVKEWYYNHNKFDKSEGR